MREHTRAPARLTFFYLYVFTPKSERQYAVWTYLVHLCFFFVCTCMCVSCTHSYVCGFYNYFFSHLSIVPWLLLLFHHLVLLFSFLSHNNTFSDFLFVKFILPPFYLAFPVSFTFWFIPSSPRSFRVTKIIRRHVRVRGIERYEEEGFEGLGGRRVAER